MSLLDLATLVAANLKAKNVATEEYSDTVGTVITDNIYWNNSTLIDGAKIKSGTIISNVFSGNVIYNLEWNGADWVPADENTYKMMIDLENGRIHIK